MVKLFLIVLIVLGDVWLADRRSNQWGNCPQLSKVLFLDQKTHVSSWKMLENAEELIMSNFGAYEANL